MGITPNIVDDFNKIKTQNSVIEINDYIKEIISGYHIGNVILFSQNFESKKQRKKLISDLHKSVMDSGNPPLTALTNQKGERVGIFAFEGNKLPNNSQIEQSIFNSHEAFKEIKIIGKEIAGLGINCNLAPVIDINSSSYNSVISVRLLG